jgi:DNA-directed RNA polymerase specialized sigma24 family protein
VVEQLFVRLVGSGLASAEADEKQLARFIQSTSTELALSRLGRSWRGDDDDREAEARAAAQGTDDLDALLSRPDFSRRVLADLDRRTQEVVVLVHFEGLTAPEAAAALNLPADEVDEQLGRYRSAAESRLAAYRQVPPDAAAGSEA